jgi:hypothetical protein
LIPDAFLRAVIRLAERQADLTADWLESMGVPHGPLKIPQAFIFELAAVLQIGQWEQQGLLQRLKIKLPTYREAADALVARAMLGLEEFHGPQATRLSPLVITVWVQQFA